MRGFLQTTNNEYSMKIFKPAFLFINIPVNCPKVKRTSVGIEFKITLLSHVRPAGTILSFHFYSKVTVHKVTAHKCEGIIRMRVLFEGGPYMRKYGR